MVQIVLNYVNKSAQIEKEKIKELLENWGRDILKKISVDTVINQIKYENAFIGVLRNSTIAAHKYIVQIVF